MFQDHSQVVPDTARSGKIHGYICAGLSQDPPQVSGYRDLTRLTVNQDPDIVPLVPGIHRAHQGQVAFFQDRFDYFPAHPAVSPDYNYFYHRPANLPSKIRPTFLDILY
jgi:hypothetical protein